MSTGAEPRPADRLRSDPPVDLPRSGDELLLGAASDARPLLSVVMPTLNEEDGVGECIQRVQNALEELQVYGEVIVSDSSTDRTPEIARANGAIVVEPDEPGYGYAYQYAFRHCRGDYVVIGDADTTYDFEAIPRLLEPVREGDADMCMGSRLDGDIESGAMPLLHQYVGNPLLTRFLNLFYGAGVSDAHSGFRVIRREALGELGLRSTGMEFASEMIMEAGARDLQIEEVPIVYHEREGDATLDSFRDGWRHVKFMLTNAPGYLFSAPAVVFTVLGIALMGLSMSGSDLLDVSLGTHTMIGGSLMTIIAYQVGTLALFSSVAADPIQSPNDPVTDWIREHFRLEHGATAGLVLSLGGAGYLAFLLYGWVDSGFVRLPVVSADMLAFTALVVGIQTMFSSFFLSMLADQR